MTGGVGGQGGYGRSRFVVSHRSNTRPTPIRRSADEVRIVPSRSTRHHAVAASQGPGQWSSVLSAFWRIVKPVEARASVG